MSVATQIVSAARLRDLLVLAEYRDLSKFYFVFTIEIRNLDNFLEAEAKFARFRRCDPKSPSFETLTLRRNGFGMEGLDLYFYFVFA